jgi:hypothetical protein
MADFGGSGRMSLRVGTPSHSLRLLASIYATVSPLKARMLLGQQAVCKTVVSD